MPSPLPAARSWLAAASSLSVSEPGRSGRRPAGLVAAVAGIVAVAAERARAAGDLGALREAIERALDAAAPPAGDPREPGATDLPRITDADPALEQTRLRALLARPQPG
ncbi:hypothetical protein [Falsiroseomonas sp.]|uniref:hypothetical protein n=1 Tax=Falsiroseomonas sp. TaxID=2870721 RepID=UPI003568EC0F